MIDISAIPPSARLTRADIDRDLHHASQLARRFHRRQHANPLWRRIRFWSDVRMNVEWLAVIAVTYWLVFLANAWYWKLALIPWSIYSSLALDSIVHNINHWPTFRSRTMNQIWRLSGILVFLIPLSIRYHHWDHHKAYDLNDDPQDELRRIRRHGGWGAIWGLGRYLAKEIGSSLWDLMPWTRHPENIQRLRAARPAHFREIALSKWARLVLFLILLAVDPFDTLCFFTPAIILLPVLASFVMNLTDHLPAQLDHPFRQATYYEPATWLERTMSTLNHHTAATHLTHHLFPQVHFAFAPRLQRRLLPLYERHGAPRSFIINTVLCGNPISLGLTLHKIMRHVGRVNGGFVEY